MQRKLELLGSARGLLDPVRRPEPFGLVMIEALACGTPVLTFPWGAAPEIVDHGSSGFVCNSHAELVAAIGQAEQLDRAGCRTAVEAKSKPNSSADRMVRDHLSLYQRLLALREIVLRGRQVPDHV